jgi:hypothetical protein
VWEEAYAVALASLVADEDPAAPVSYRRLRSLLGG